MILSKIIKPLYIKANKSICNASLLHINGKDYLMARQSNYSCGNTIYDTPTYYVQDNIFTDELLYEINLETGNTKFIKYITKVSEEDKKKYTSNGFEDFRIIKWNGKNYIFTVLDKNHTCQVFEYELDNNFNLKNQKTNKTSNKIEKNWQPIEICPDEVIYSYKPFKLYNFNTKTYREINNICHNYSGSSQIISINSNENLGIIHTRNGRKYLHYFILFNNDMKIIKISKPFSFIGLDVEFNCFIEKYNNNCRIIAGINDSNAILFDIPIKTIYDIINDKIKTSNLIDETVINEMWQNNNDVLSKLCIATYTYNKYILEQSIKINFNSNLDRKIKEKLQKIYLHRYNKK